MAKQVAPATIHTVDALLKKLPKKDPQRPVSMSKAIAQLMPAIKTAIDLGHSPADIAAVFAKGGIEIGEPTLKAYMRQGSARTNASPPNDRAATATEVGSVEIESAPSSMETQSADMSDSTEPAAEAHDPCVTTMSSTTS